jgi:hypothetical protein
MMRLAFGVLTISLAMPAHATQKRVQPPVFTVTPEDELPVPPIPPATETPYLAAPMPDTALGAPPDPLESKDQGARLSPGFYHPKDYNIGEGYLNGSTVQGEQERRAQPVPRLQFKMPLQ